MKDPKPDDSVSQMASQRCLPSSRVQYSTVQYPDGKRIEREGKGSVRRSGLHFWILRSYLGFVLVRVIWGQSKKASMVFLSQIDECATVQNSTVQYSTVPYRTVKPQRKGSPLTDPLARMNIYSTSDPLP